MNNFFNYTFSTSSISTKLTAHLVRVFSLAICLMLVFNDSFADTPKKPTLTPAEDIWLSKHPVVRLGIDPSYAPYSWIDTNGHLVGEVADYISIISKQLGIKFQIANAEQWSEILDAVKQRRIDMVATVVETPERKKYLSFTEIYIKTPLVVMTRSNDISLRSADELAHRVVALVQDYSSTQQVLAAYPDIKALFVKSPLQGLIAVATGEADAYVGAIGVNLATARQNGIANLRIATAYKLDNGQRFAVRDDWATLTRILDKALAAIPDATKASIQNKWVPQQIPIQHSGLPVLSSEQKRWVTDHRQIRVGLLESDEPNEFVSKDGNPAGFVPDYLDLVGAKTGLNIKIVQLKNRAELLAQIDAGLLDMVSMQMSPTRIHGKHLLSVPLYIGSIGVFARRDATFIGSLTDLKGKRVALTPDLVDQRTLRRQPDIVPLTLTDSSDVLQAVLDGNADAATLEIDTGQYLLEKHGIKQLHMAHVIPGEEISLRFVVRADWPELQEIVDKALAATTPEEVVSIRRQVLGSAIQRGVPIEQIRLWSLLALIAVLVLFLLQTYRGNKRLSAEVERRRLADASATSSEQRFRKFFELGNIGMAITSLEQEWLNVNPRLCEMFGYTKEEFSGMTWLEMTHADDIEADMVQYRQILAGKIEHYSMDKRFIHKNGDIVYTFLTVSSQRRPDRSVEYILATLEDISERKRTEQALQESNTRLVDIFETMSDGFITFDTNMNYTYVNAHSGEILGRKAADLIGKNYWQEYPEAKDTPFAKAYERALKTQVAIIFEAYYAPFDRWFENRIYPSGAGLSVFFTEITERKRAESKIKRLSQLYAALSQCNQAIVRATSETELFPQICRDTVEFGGMKMAWIGMIDEDSKMIRPVASFGAGTEYLNSINISLDPDSSSAGGPTFTSIHDDRPYWVQNFQLDPTTAPWHKRAAKYSWGASASLPLHRNGVVVGAFGLYAGEVNVFDESMQKLLVEMSTDISFALGYFDNMIERKQALEKIKFQNTILQTQQETSLDAILVVDEDGKISSHNQQFIDLWRLTEPLLSAGLDAPIQKYILDQIENIEGVSDKVLHLERYEEKSREEILLKDGRVIDRYSAPIIGTHDEYYGRVWYFRDITERKHAEERISYLANFDALTGLPNRAKLADNLKYVLSLVKRRNGHFAMMFIDIDRFKNINDTLGHSVGDALLVVIAGRLQMVLRDEDMAARLGGDEFILMLPDCDTQGAAQVAEKLLQAISEPCRIEQYDLAVTASIGIALYPEDGTDMESLSKSADNAMYKAKHKGRNGYRFFTTDMQASATRDMNLVNALRFALERDQLEVYYQPQVSINDGRIVGVEALLRWTHAELGSISPAEFIPLAEDSGLILPIGEWVMRTAVKQLKRWMDSGYPPMVVAVNLSAVQFRHPSLPDMVTGILNEAGLPSQYLELELTEGVPMYDPEGAIAVMNKLNDRGIRMSIDDFGTGYSSLNYLKKFKVYKLKIDQSFVRDIGTDPDDRAIVEAIISMSNSLGLQTIAEGVENPEQLAYLREQGCDEVQGYFISKPLATDRLEAFLTNYRTL